MSIRTLQFLMGMKAVTTLAPKLPLDVVNSEDINIYRDLAGGVTVSLLHGSANPLGTFRNCKMEMGAPAEEMLYKKSTWFYQICFR
jgi:hypothetical protein